MDFVVELVVDFVHLLVVEKNFYDLYVFSVFLVYDILEYFVQIYLVIRNHHLRINNPFDKMSVFYFYFVEKMGNFHCDPVEDLFGNLLN